MGLATQEDMYLSGRTVLNCGDATAAEIDQEVMAILKRSYEEAKRLLLENRKALDKIAEFLIEKETITGKEFMEIFRKVQADEKRQKKSRQKKKRDEQMPYSLSQTKRRMRNAERISSKKPLLPQILSE